MQKILKPTFYLTYRDDQPKVIEGKPLGFIDKKQFYLVCNDPIKFVRKLLSVAPRTLKDIADSGVGIKDHRFVFSTLGQKLERQVFISQELSYITSVTYVQGEVSDLELVDKNNKLLFLECRFIG